MVLSCKQQRSIFCMYMSKYCFDDLLRWITSYNQHQNTRSNPVAVSRSCSAVDHLGQQCVAAVAPQSHPFCKPISFFSSASRALFFISGATWQCSQPTKMWDKSKQSLRCYKFWRMQDAVGQHILMSFHVIFVLDTVNTHLSFKYKTGCIQTKSGCPVSFNQHNRTDCVMSSCVLDSSPNHRWRSIAGRQLLFVIDYSRLTQPTAVKKLSQF